MGDGDGDGAGFMVRRAISATAAAVVPWRMRPGARGIARASAMGRPMGWARAPTRFAYLE